MREFEQKQKFKKRIYSKFTIIILLVILVFLGKGTYEIWEKERQSKNTLSIEKEKLENLKERKDLLNLNIEYVNSEVGKEELVREKFNVLKEGEKEVFIIEEKSEPEPEPEPSKLTRFWHNFTNLIGF